MKKRVFVILVVSILAVSMISHYFSSQTGYLTYEDAYSRFSRTTPHENIREHDISSISVYPQEKCKNGVDDDFDGKIDCQDKDCKNKQGPCGICEYPVELTCDDFCDNDGNSLEDCGDPSCVGTPVCVVTGGEICDNGVDDDGDGFLDCEDPDCAGTSSCVGDNCDYYLDPQGNDNNVGDVDNPWKTLEYGVTQLIPGDVLCVNGGVYYETNIDIDIAGTPSFPITIQATTPGHHPLFDGSIPEFSVSPNTAWELIDNQQQIYRSTTTYSGFGLLHGYFGSDNGDWRLVPYERDGPFDATTEAYNQAGDFYVGPGLRLKDDDHIYYRSQQSLFQTNGLLGQTYNVPVTSDPGLTPLYIFDDSDSILYFDPTAAHLVFDGIDLFYAGKPIHIADGGVHHLTFRDVEVRGGRYTIRVGDDSHDILFDGLIGSYNMPPWVSRSDVKRPSGCVLIQGNCIQKRPAHLFQGNVINIDGEADAIEVTDSVFSYSFDGIGAQDGIITNLHIHDSLFDGVADDTVTFGTVSSHIEFNNNHIINAFSGPSREGDGSNPQPGNTFIHHNIIDTSAFRLIGRCVTVGNGCEILVAGSKWAGPQKDGLGSGRTINSHTTSGIIDDPWKIYHNTILVTWDMDYEGTGVCYKENYVFTPGVTPQEVYNNIIVQTYTDRPLSRRCVVDDGSQILDGNLYFREDTLSSTDPLFMQVYDGGSETDFESLDGPQQPQFIGSSHHTATKMYYSPGWDTTSFEGDPELNSNYEPPVGGLTDGNALDITSKNWPGLVGETFIGALSPV
jgi:hypothetical protein